jgi:hypothetical protein
MRGFRRIAVVGGTFLLGGCASPVGNLIALQGEGASAGARLVAGVPVPQDARAVPAFASVDLAWVGPLAYVRGEAALLPPTPLFAGGSLGGGMHWQDRLALGGHVVMGEGAGWGADLSLRPWDKRPWVLAVSWTPSQRRVDSLADGRPRIGLAHDWQASLGWAPVADSLGGLMSVELGAQKAQAPGGWSGWLRISGALRFFAPTRKGP